MSSLGTWANASFGALRNDAYRQLWFGSSLAAMTFTMMFVVQAVVAFDLTGKNSAVGALALAAGLTQAVFAPIGGAYADRVSRNRVLVITQGFVGATFLLLGALLVAGWLTLPILLACAFADGVAFGFLVPARQAFTGEVLPPGLVANGIALQQLSMTATRVVGPFIVGAAVAAAWFGAGGVYICMAVMMGGVLALMLRLPQSRPLPHSGVSVAADLRSGIGYIWASTRIRLLMLMLIAILTFGQTYQALLPGYLQNALNHDTGAIAWLYGSAALGGLMASVALAGFAGSRHAPVAMLLGAAVLGVSLLLTARADTMPTAVAVIFGVGGGVTAFQVLNVSLLIRAADPSHYGRVAALTPMAFGISQIAQFPIGVLADHAGERQALATMGAGVLAVTLLGILSLGALRSAVAQPRIVPSPAGDS